MLRALVLLTGASLLANVHALEIEQLDIEKDGKVYHIRMNFTIEARPDEVVAVLTDYENPDRLNPDVTNREIIAEEGATTRVLTEIRSCLFLFCRDITMIQDVTVTGTTIDAAIVPGSTHFRSGTMRWSITENDQENAQVIYTAIMEPDVFIPPLVGRAMIRKMLKEEVRATAARLETEVTGQAAE
jgi:hypothetical protein